MTHIVLSEEIIDNKIKEQVDTHSKEQEEKVDTHSKEQVEKEQVNTQEEKVDTHSKEQVEIDTHLKEQEEKVDTHSKEQEEKVDTHLKEQVEIDTHLKEQVEIEQVNTQEEQVETQGKEHLHLKSENFHVDLKRDNTIGIELSKMNLNYTFKQPIHENSKLFGIVYNEIPKLSLPTLVDLRPQFGLPLNQFTLGDCVANSTAGALRYTFAKERLGVFNPSRLFIYYNGRKLGGYPTDKDTGITVENAYESISKYSTCSEELMPYIIAQYAQAPTPAQYSAALLHKTFQYLSLNASQLKQCIAQGYVVSFGIILYPSFMTAQTAKTGLVSVPNTKMERSIGGHCMCITGYDDSKQSFIVTNSWGKNWGINGSCYIPYTYMSSSLCSDFYSCRLFS
jgi:C1A family cysteine protease